MKKSRNWKKLYKHWDLTLSTADVTTTLNALSTKTIISLLSASKTVGLGVTLVVQLDTLTVYPILTSSQEEPWQIRLYKNKAPKTLRTSGSVWNLSQKTLKELILLYLTGWAGESSRAGLEWIEEFSSLISMWKEAKSDSGKYVMKKDLTEDSLLHEAVDRLSMGSIHYIMWKDTLFSPRAQETQQSCEELVYQRWPYQVRAVGHNSIGWNNTQQIMDSYWYAAETEMRQETD